MNEQQSENNQAVPAAPRYIRLMIRGEVLRFNFDTATTLPADDRFLVDCGTLTAVVFTARRRTALGSG